MALRILFAVAAAVAVLKAPASAEATPEAEIASSATVVEAQTPAPAAIRVLSDADAALYREIFDLQEDGRWTEADRKIAQLESDILLGYVQYQRYMHPTAYRSKFDELKRWMAYYADHPEADKIYSLARKRRPSGQSNPVRPIPRKWKAAPEKELHPDLIADYEKTGKPRLNRIEGRVRYLSNRERAVEALREIEGYLRRGTITERQFDRMRSWIAASLLCLGFAVAGPAPAPGHDLESLAHPSARLSRETSRAAIEALRAPDAYTRSVLVRLKSWPYRTLTACFFGGADALRRRIVETARAWYGDAAVGLAVDFGTPPAYRTCSGRLDESGRYPEDIRIGFRDPRGFWAYIGLDAHGQQATAGGATMNLRWFDISPKPSPLFEQKVLHEFGHVFGFHHEHQSPEVACESEFDIEAIKQTFGWDDPTAETNLAVLARDSSMYLWSQPDPESIMMYDFRAELLKKGKESRCYIEPNFTLSRQDRRAMRDAYPASEPPRPLLTRGIEPFGAMTLPESVKALIELRARLERESR